MLEEMNERMALRDVVQEEHFSTADLGEPVPYVGQRSYHERSVREAEVTPRQPRAFETWEYQYGLHEVYPDEDFGP